MAEKFNNAAPGWQVDMRELAAELRQLKSLLLARASEPEHLHAVAEIEFARLAAEASDEQAVLRHLRAAGQRAPDLAANLGMPAAAAALEAALNLPG